MAKRTGPWVAPRRTNWTVRSPGATVRRNYWNLHFVLCLFPFQSRLLKLLSYFAIATPSCFMHARVLVCGGPLFSVNGGAVLGVDGAARELRKVLASVDGPLALAARLPGDGASSAQAAQRAAALASQAVEVAAALQAVAGLGAGLEVATHAAPPPPPPCPPHAPPWPSTHCRLALRTGPLPEPFPRGNILAHRPRKRSACGPSQEKGLSPKTHARFVPLL
jgi:hypothetical protein